MMHQRVGALLVAIVLAGGGCRAKPPSLIANDDEITASAGEIVFIDLLTNDENLEGGEKFLGFHTPLKSWGAPGRIIEGNKGGKIFYQTPSEPGVYEFEYWLYDVEPTASESSPNQPVAGKLVVTVIGER